MCRAVVRYFFFMIKAIVLWRSRSVVVARFRNMDSTEGFGVELQNIRESRTRVSDKRKQQK